MIVIESAIMKMRCAGLTYYYFVLESYCKLSLVRRLYCYWSSSAVFILFVSLFSFLFLQNGKSRLTFYAISQMYLLLILNSNYLLIDNATTSLMKYITKCRKYYINSLPFFLISRCLDARY